MRQLLNSINTIILVIVLVCIFLITALFTRNTLAQTSPSNFRQMLESISSQIDETSGSSIGITFVEPLIEDEPTWSIPFSDRELGLERWIGEIGDDYICFHELSGSAGIVRCTPFTNIVSISYLGNL